MNTRLIGYLTVLSVLALTSTAAIARKPDPKPVRPPEEVKAPDIKLFKAAYERAGEPRLLVICGLDARSGSAGVIETHEKTATGSPSGSRHIGRHISLFDATGDAAKLKSDIEEILLKNKDLELVDVDSLSEKDRREVELLEMRKELEAVRLLARKVNAEVVLKIRLKTIAGDLAKDRHKGYRVFVSIIQVVRGRKIGGFAFDWKIQKSDSLTIKKYARAITAKFIRQFSDWFTGAGGTVRSYTVRLLGVSDVGDLVRIRKAFAEIPGVKSVKSRGLAGTGRASVSEMKLSYAGAHLDSLLYHLQKYASRETGKKVVGIDAAAGMLTLSVTGQGIRPATAVPRIGIMKFDVSKDLKPSLGEFLYDSLTDKMVKSKRFTVVDWEEIDRVTKHIANEQKNISSEEAQKKALDALGIDRMYLGRVSRIARKYHVSVKTLTLDLKVTRIERELVGSERDLEGAMEYMARLLAAKSDREIEQIREARAAALKSKPSPEPLKR